MQMDADEFFDLVEIANKREREEMIHRQWCSMLPFMSLKMLEYMSFPEYVEKCSGTNIDLRPVSEIVKDIESTHKKSKTETR